MDLFYKQLIKELSELYPNPKYGDYVIFKTCQFAFDGERWVIIR